MSVAHSLRLLVVAIGLCLTWVGTVAGTRTSEAVPMTVEELTRLRESLPPMDFENPQPPSPAAAAYFDFYGLNPPGAEHLFGTFRAGPYVLAAHAFRPEAPRGTVMVLHGFFDHTGTISFAIRHLLALGFAVAAFDLPGHGLSSGPRADIADFADYAGALDEFLRLCRAHMPPPCHAVAHSTGAAILATRLLTHRDEDLGQVVMVAPLVRSAHWGLSTRTARLLNVIVDDVPRVFRENTSDESFADFVRKDPLQAGRASLTWVQALVEWNERVSQYPSSPRPILIIQGDEDTVVDWEYNLDFLRTKFPRARVEMIPGGRHQLLGERPDIRKRVLRIVGEALSAEPGG